MAHELITTFEKFAKKAAKTRAEPFKYGRCRTDYKDGKKLNEDLHDDFFKKTRYRASVKKMLTQLGLPHPEKKDIFHGASHEMLFISSHGVVVRIGPLDVEDLINPGILQPLGYLQDKNILIGLQYPLTVAIYPGIALYENLTKHDFAEDDLTKIIEKSGNYAAEIVGRNMGVINTLHSTGLPVPTPLLLDIDNDFNNTVNFAAPEKRQIIKKLSDLFKNKVDILFCTQEKLFTDTENLYRWQQALEAHQPLRQLFWDIFKDDNGKPDKEARDTFWKSCATLVNAPQAMTMPLWHMATDSKKRTVFIREETLLPQVALYRPWTGKKEDRRASLCGIDQKIIAQFKKAKKRQPSKKPGRMIVVG